MWHDRDIEPTIMAHMSNEMLFELVVSCVLFVVCQGQNYYSCAFVNSQDCSAFIHDPVCGTDGITYDNRCAFGQAHCNIHTVDLHILHAGSCDPDAITHPSTTLAHGSDVVLDYFCNALSHTDCPSPRKRTVADTVCGTDGKTYVNFCEYEKARCTHRDLHVQDWGDCVAV